MDGTIWQESWNVQMFLLRVCHLRVHWFFFNFCIRLYDITHLAYRKYHGSIANYVIGRHSSITCWTITFSNGWIDFCLLLVEKYNWLFPNVSMQNRQSKQMIRQTNCLHDFFSKFFLFVLCLQAESHRNAFKSMRCIVSFIYFCTCISWIAVCNFHDNLTSFPNTPESVLQTLWPAVYIWFIFGSFWEFFLQNIEIKKPNTPIFLINYRVDHFNSTKII